MPDRRLTTLGELPAYNPQLERPQPLDPLAQPVPTAVPAPAPQITPDALTSALQVAAPAEPAVPASQAERAAGLARLGILRPGEDGRMGISRSGLLDFATQRDWQNMNQYQRSVEVDEIAAELAYASPSPTTPERMRNMIAQQMEGSGIDLSQAGVGAGVWRMARGIPGALAGGVGQTGEVASGLVGTARGVLAEGERLIDRGARALLGDEFVEAIDAYAPDVLGTAAGALQIPGDVLAATGRAGQEVLTPTQITEAQEYASMLVDAGDWSGLADFLIANPAGWTVISGTVIESLVPFIVARGGSERAARALQSAAQRSTAAAPTTASITRAQTPAVTRGSQAVDVGVTAGLIGTGQTAAEIAGDQDGPMSAAQTAGALLGGLVVGGTSGVAARLGPTPEAVISRVLSGTPAAARQSASGMRSWLTGSLASTLRGAGLEASSEGVQEAIQSIITDGYDAQGNWSAENIDPSVVAASGVFGAIVGGPSGAVSGAIDGRQARLAGEELAAIEADQARIAEAEVEQARLAARTPDQVITEDAVTPRVRGYVEPLAGGQVTAQSLRDIEDQVALDLDELAPDSRERPSLEADLALLRQQIAVLDAAQLAQETAIQTEAGLTLADPLAAPPLTPEGVSLASDLFGGPPQGPVPATPSEPLPAAPEVAPGQGDLIRDALRQGDLFSDQRPRIRLDAQGRPVVPGTTLDYSAQRRLPGLDTPQAPAPAPVQGQMDLRSDQTQGDMFMDSLRAEVAERDAVQNDARNEVDGALGDVTPGAVPSEAVIPQLPGATDPLGPVTETAVDPLAAEQVSAPGEPDTEPAEAPRARTELNVESVAQAVADDPQGLPPRPLFASPDAWQTRRAQQAAQFAANAYNLDPSERPRARVIENLSDIVRNGQRPDGDWRGENTRSFRDAQRAADILQAMRLAEEARPDIAEGDTVDAQGNLELPSGELPAGNDASLQHHAEFAEFLAAGDITGALRWARDNLTTTTNRLIGPLATMSARPEVALRIELEPQARVIRGRSVEAWFDPQTATIHITQRSAGTPYYLLHEVAHALTENAIQNPDILSGEQANALDVLYGLYEEARDAGLLPDYALQSLSEFVAESFSNPDVQARMTYRSSVPGVSRLHTAFRAFANIVRRVLGIPSSGQSALESVAVAGYAISSPAQRQADRVRVESEADISVDYAVLNAFVRDPDSPHKKTHAASIVPETDGDGYELRFMDGRPSQVYTTSENAAEALAQQMPEAQIREGSQVEQAAPTESVNDVDNLSPLARAVNAAVDRTLGLANPRYATAVKDTLTRSMRYLKQTQINSMAVLEELQRRTGVPIYDEHIVNRSEQLARWNRDAGDISQFVEAVGRGLSAINSNTNRFGDYLYALHVEERNRQRAGESGRDVTAFSYEYNGVTHDNPGRTAARANELAREYLQTLTPQEREVFSRLERQMRAMMDEMLVDEYNLGMYTKEEFLNLGGVFPGGRRADNAYKHYVPLLNEQGSGSSVPGSVTGRDTRARNPFESVYRQLVERSARLGAMSTRKNLLRLMQENPDPALATIKPTRVVWTGSEFESRGVSSTARDNSIFIPDKGGWVRLEVKTSHPQGQLLLDAFNKQARSPEVERMLNGLSSMTRALSGMMTTYNPAFTLKSISWDLTTTLFNFQGAYDRNLSVYQAYRLSGQAIFNAARALGMERTGITRGRPSDRDPVMALFQRLGGGINIGALSDGPALASDIRKGMLGNPSELRANPLLMARAGVSSGLEMIGHTLHAPTQALRYGGFKAYIEHAAGRTFGPNDTEALIAWVENPDNQQYIRNAVRGSKTISGNFEQRGSVRTVPSLFAFWNAAMQGTQLFASMASTGQGISGMITLLVLGAAAAAQAVNDPEDEEADGGSRYARSRDRLSSLLVGGESGFQWPVAYELRVPFLIGQTFTLTMMGKLNATDAFMDVLGATRDMFAPSYGFSDTDAGFNTMQAVTPTAAQLVLAPLAYGTDPFGNSIDPEYIRMPDGRWSNEFRDSEAVNARTMEWVASLTSSLDEATDGRINWSPARLSQMVENVLGGTARYVRQSMALPNPDTGFSSTPAIQGMTRAFRARDNYSALRNEYEDRMARLQARIRRADAAMGGDNILAENPYLNEARRISGRVDREIRNLTVGGMSQSEIYAMLDKATADRDEAAGLLAQELQRTFFRTADEIRAQAMAELEELETRYENQ